MNKAQVKAIIKLLKSEDGTRPALQRVFEQGGYIWATDGYVALEVGQAQDDIKGKCITLPTLIAWNATHTHATDMISEDEWQDNDEPTPDMVSLLHKEYDTLTEPPRVNIDNLKLACDFLGIKSMSLEKHDNCYRVKPLNTDEQPIIIKAMESQAYVMRLL